MQYKVGDKVKITNSCSKDGTIRHYIKVGTIAEITDIYDAGDEGYKLQGISVTDGRPVIQAVYSDAFEAITETKTNTNMNQTLKNLVFQTARQLLVANNTITTLEIKTQLRKDQPNYYWIQNTTNSVTGVSEYVNELVEEGVLKIVDDNGTYRTYADPTQKPRKSNVSKTTSPASTPAVTGTVKATITRKKALELMQNNKGHFFTVEFKKKDGSDRTLNGQYVKDQKNSALGYVLVKEASKLKTKDKEPIRNVNLQTLQSLRIGGQTYKIR